jgi:hypothetical protein
MKGIISGLLGVALLAVLSACLHARRRSNYAAAIPPEISTRCDADDRTLKTF